MSEEALKGKTIVFADDEPHFIEALIAVVEAEGANVVICRNASDAVDTVLNRNVDCLVIDVMMNPGKKMPEANPQRAGIDAIKRIREKKPRQDIICLSVISDQVEISQLKKSGVLFLRKAETSLEKTVKLIVSKATGTYEVR
jgi:CheY-like chemotaxis protein